jgi:hypothetical protein
VLISVLPFYHFWYAHEKKMWCKSQDCENDWHVRLTIFLQTKYSWPMTCSNWRTDNDENVTQVTEPWKWGQDQVTPARLTSTPYNVYIDQI